jgi:hypothetical protein
MDTKKQPDPERTIVVRAVYLGDEPDLSEPEKPFFLGSMPIINAITKQRDIQTIVAYGQTFPNVEFLHGSLSYNPDEGRAGVTEETVLVIYDVPISVAEEWKTIERWKFEKTSWTKYREIITSQYERVIRARDNLADKLTTGWARFFGLKIDEIVPQVIRIDVWLGKHRKDREFKSTDRYHYHVNLKEVKVADLFNAVEYIEQAFYSLGVDCEVAVSIDTEQVYKTPKGLTDEPKA